MTPRPAWVAAVEPSPASASQRSLASGGEAYELVDTQVLSTPARRSRYRRFVTRALNANGVDSAASIEMVFDPSWQSLELHSLDVVRDGRVMHRLGSARIQVIQREKERDARIFDETKAVSIQLDDVRVGDVVDYSFSTIGRNPIFGGREFSAIDLQSEVPIAHLHARLVLPEAERFRPGLYRSKVDPVVRVVNGLRDYRWDLHDVPALVVDPDAPAWFNPYPAAEWSAFESWTDVSRWALPLYARPARLGPALDAAIARIAREQPTPQGRMLAALRFAQGEIRYLGIETGLNSHAPHAPELVYRRRFGDCKDKALLTLSMLDRLGVEAHAVLVNTASRRGIAQHPPSPGAFDHVLVQARIGARLYWIDPTRPVQESDLDSLYQPDYDLGLVVSQDTRNLVSMRSPASASSRRASVTFDASAGFDTPARMTVTTVYTGAEAEAKRDAMARTNLEDVQRQYLQYYVKTFPSIRVAAPVDVTDDKARNQLATIEHYEIREPAPKAGADGERRFEIATPDVDDLLSEPKSTIRTTPLAIGYPVDVEQSTDVLLPEAWKITPVDLRVDDPVFAFRRTVGGSPDTRRVHVQDSFRTLADSLAAADMPRYLGNLKRAREGVGYELTWTEPQAKAATTATAPGNVLERINWPVLLVALLCLPLWIGLARRAFRYDPVPVAAAGASPAGIGGWLALLAFSLSIAPLRLALGIAKNTAVLDAQTWASHGVFGGADFHPAWAPLVMAELVANLGLLVFSVLLLVLLARQRSNFPRCVLGFLVASATIQLLDALAAAQIPSVESGVNKAVLATGLVVSAAWGAYLLRSKRVRATFVQRLGASPPPREATVQPHPGATPPQVLPPVEPALA